MTGVVGGGIVACGAMAGLAIADAPMAVLACAMFGLLWVSMAVRAVMDRVRRWYRALPVPPAWGAPVTGVLALAYAVICAGMTLARDRAGAVAFGLCAVALAGTCAWSATARWARWTGGDRRWLEETGAALPEVRGRRP